MHAATQDETVDREEQQSAFSVGSTPNDSLSELKPTARAKPEQSPPCEQEPSVLAKPPSARRRAAKQFLRSMSLTLATLAIFLVAVLVSIVAWDQYVTSPWTRDGSVRVQVASIAPQVSGQIMQLWITDNQFVRKGDILYQIEPFDFDVTLRTSKALLEEREADQHVKQLQSERRQRLSDLATTPEEQQVFQGSAVQAKAAVDAAREQVAQADINLKRTEVHSPVNGYVTNLLLRVGDYAHAGVSNMSVVDSDSFWVDGYFEETKLARVCVGDRAEVKLIGYSAPIAGHGRRSREALACPTRRPALRGFPMLTRSTRGYG
jgi:multidrug resistance efflux pump